MDNQEKKKLRPLYREFQDYLSQAPTIQVQPYLGEPEEWEHFNHAIDLLNTATGKNYDRFKVAPEGGRTGVSTTTYRANLGGIIGNLHGEFFSDEPAPFSGVPSSPSTAITLNQSQQQSVSVLILDLQRKIDEKLATTQDDKEKGFLKKLESLLPTITNGVQLVKLVLDLITQMGLDPHQISTLFA